MATYPMLERLQRPGLVTNPGRAWHEKEAARARGLWRKAPVASRQQSYFAGSRDAHDYSTEVSARRGMNPWAGWHEARRLQYGRLARAAPKGSRKRAELRAAAAAHAESERASRQLGEVALSRPSSRGVYLRENVRRPIRYSRLSKEDRKGIIAAYQAARPHATDALHAAAIAAHDHFRMTDKEWNGPRGSDAFAAAVTVLAFKGVMQVNPHMVIDTSGKVIASFGGHPTQSFPKAYRRYQEDPRAAEILTSPRRLPVGAQVSPVGRHLMGGIPGVTKRNPSRYASRIPPGAVEIYGRVNRIFATKGRASRYPGQRFVHRFTKPARILGLPDGRLLITPVGRR